MNHAPISILRWVRRAFIGYSLHFLVGYGLVLAVFHTGAAGTYAYTPVIVIMVIVQMLYETVASKRYFKTFPWLITAISLGFAVLESFYAVETTGVYTSPYFIPVIIACFLAGTLGLYVVPAIVFTLLVGLILGISGYFTTPTNTPLGFTVLILATIAGLVGYFFWKRYYVNKESGDAPRLSSLLRQEQLKSNLIIDSIDDGVVLIDEKNVVRLFNPAAQKIVGMRGDDVIGLDYKSSIKLFDDAGKPYEPQQDPFAQVFDKGLSVHDNSASIANHDKKQIEITITASPLLDADNNVTGVIGVFRDVTEERRQEKRSAEFVSTASHEMRTPVAAIEGYLALALNDRVSKIDSAARGYLEKAHESTQHLGRLFQDLLTSTKAEDGRIGNHPKVVEMSSFIDKLVEDLRFSAEKKGLKMEYVMGTPDNSVKTNTNPSSGVKVVKPFYYVEVDPERLREVVTNLFDNAVKYTESGKVTIGLTGNNDVIQISVNDTGPGIPSEDIPHLFQKFYRVDNSSTRTIGGTGLGLFICAKIIELYSGRIWVESQIGKGSTFYINLPRLSNEMAKKLEAGESSTSTTVTPLSNGSTS
ncbi:MAG: ATP-binding protein [Candidatus Saccharibacteria bacterium]